MSSVPNDCIIVLLFTPVVVGGLHNRRRLFFELISGLLHEVDITILILTKIVLWRLKLCNLAVDTHILIMVLTEEL